MMGENKNENEQVLKSEGWERELYGLYECFLISGYNLDIFLM